MRIIIVSAQPVHFCNDIDTAERTADQETRRKYGYRIRLYSRQLKRSE